ncbi:MAG TPA: hypothetical protein VK919_00420 [Solirubrobacterales bacterium]|nr:hypothetical protein [Solirubrobacterales bacterium]
MSADPARTGLRRAGIAASVALLAAALALLVVGPGSADAHKRSVATTILFGAGDVTDDDQVLFLGRVKAPARSCRAFRPVTMTFVYSDGRRRVDRGPTSRNGAFALLGPFDPEPDRVVFRAPRKRFAPKGKRHRHVCRGARLVLPIN